MLMELAVFMVLMSLALLEIFCCWERLDASTASLLFLSVMVLMGLGGGIFLSAAHTEQTVAEDRATRSSPNHTFRACSYRFFLSMDY